MGHRANLFLVQDQRVSIYYSHWAAITLTADLFWGPDHALQYLRDQREVDETRLLDDVWAEGAAVVDCDKKLLLLFGGEDLRYDVPLRRVYLQLIRRVWSPWAVRWAYEGFAEIAEAVGIPSAKVLSTDDSGGRPTPSLTPPPEREWTRTVGSVRATEGTLLIFPLEQEPRRYLMAGPKLIEEAQRSHGLEHLHWAEWVPDGFPTGGFHFDLSKKTLDFWSAADEPQLMRHLPDIWQSWMINWHKDEFESQLELTDGKVSFPVQSKDVLQDKLRQVLLDGDVPTSLPTVPAKKKFNPVQTMFEIITKLASKGQTVKVSPFALRDDRLELSLAERRRIFEFAIGAA